MAKTKLIAIEGIDGSGKTLQAERLAARLLACGKSVATMSFPNYEGFFGAQCGALLRGDGLRADAVDSRSLCLWYALDRWDRFKTWRDGESDILLVNRFTLSNAVYQSVRTIDVGAPDNWDWVKRLEHVELGLPEPDLYVLLDIEPKRAQENVDLKDERDYVKGRDVYEAQEGLLARARARYLDIAAKSENVALLRCMDENGRLAAPDAIEAAIWRMVEERGLLR